MSSRRTDRCQPSEKAWQQTIVQAAQLLGWAVYHTFDSRHSAPGLPDLCLARPGQLLFIEVKSQCGRVRGEQLAWLDLLGTIPGVAVMIARPDDWDAVETALRRTE